LFASSVYSTLALSQRARALEKTDLKIDIRYSSSKPIAF
jgi:hypothetical protein